MVPSSSMATPSARGILLSRPLKPPSRLMKLTGSPFSSSSSSRCDSADSTRVWPVRGSTLRAETLRMYRSSLGSAVIAPLRLGPPSLFQLNRVIGSRSLLSNRRCWRGSQAMPSKPLFFLPILPSGNSARLLVLSSAVCGSTWKMVRVLRRSSVTATLPFSSTATPSGLLRPSSGMVRSTSPVSDSSTSSGRLPVTVNRVLVAGL